MRRKKKDTQKWSLKKQCCPKCFNFYTGFVYSTLPIHTTTCSANYHHILNECDTMYDVSVHDIGRVWQAGLSNVTISNVNVLSEMLDIRNGFKTGNILDDDDVNCIITDITVF